MSDWSSERVLFRSLASRRCLQEEHPMTNRLRVIITAIVAVVGFGTATFLYEPTATKPAANPTAQDNFLVRDHSPILGPPDAPVTIVEFFDPACEARSAEHTSELQSLMRSSYAVFCLKKNSTKEPPY